MENASVMCRGLRVIMWRCCDNVEVGVVTWGGISETWDGCSGIC